MTLTGSTLSIGEKSSAVFGSNVVNLACGSVDAVTTAKLGMNVDGVSIVPASPSAKYSVISSQAGLRVVSLAGNLIAVEGGTQHVIESGKEATFAARTGCSIASADDTKGGKMDDKEKMKHDRAAWWPWGVGAAVVGGGIAAVILTNRGGGAALSQAVP